MANRKGFFDSPEKAELVSAVRARNELEQSRLYRDEKKREALINAVRIAVEPFCHVAEPADLTAPVGDHENPLLRLAPGPSLGFVNGFLCALEIGDPALLAVTKAHGLYFSGKAALALTQPGDSVNDITVLSNIIAKVKADEVGATYRAVSLLQRKPFNQYAKDVLRRCPSMISAREFWEELKKTDQVVEFNGRSFTINVSEQEKEVRNMLGVTRKFPSGILDWVAMNKGDETEIYEGKIEFLKLEKLLSKLKNPKQ